jgi:hypothetical protein
MTQGMRSVVSPPRWFSRSGIRVGSTSRVGVGGCVSDSSTLFLANVQTFRSLSHAALRDL